MYKYLVGISDLKVGKYSPNLSSQVRHESIKACSKRICINVRGTLYETLQSTLARFPRTLLGSRVTKPGFNFETIYLDKDLQCFEAILFYYQSGGMLVCPTTVQMSDFIAACQYFMIDEDAVSELKVREHFSPEKDTQEAHLFPQTLKEHLWYILESKVPSGVGKIYAVLVCSLIVIYAILICVLSAIKINTVFRHSTLTFEIVLNAIFAFEWITRFLVSPTKTKFLIKVLNIVDFAACVPWLLHLFTDANSNFGSFLLSTAYIFCMVRLLRAARYVPTLKKVLSIASSSLSDLQMFFFCTSIACLFFASCEYYMESNAAGTAFTSIPESMWWCIQTMVSLGYGDIVPVTALGKLTASCVAIFGTVTLTVPLMCICGNLLTMYAQAFPGSGIGNKSQSK